MDKPGKPPPPSDAPTIVPESAGSQRQPYTAELTPPPPSRFDAPTMVPESAAPSSGSASDSPTLVPTSSGGGSGSGVSRAPESWSGSVLQPGTVLGGRYEILQALGEGGMGAVYKANDRELERMVALKVIRPDLARNPAIIQRFKQELILARQV